MQSSFSHLIHRDNPSKPTADPARSQPQRTKRQSDDKIDAVLYVWGDEEPSSSNAIDMANQSGAIDFMSIVDVRDLRFSEIPEWLQGVPTVLTVQDQMMYKGTTALEFMSDMMRHSHMYRNTAKPPPQQQQQMQQGGMQQMQPDPRMMQQGMQDPRMMQPDPRMAQQMQPDPRMAQQMQPDSRMMQQDPRMMQQMQQDPRMMQQAMMPMQQIEGIGQIPHRQTSMMRGADERMSQQPQQQQPMMQNMGDDTKVSANSMQAEIEQILARREQMMNDAGNQNQPRPPLPTVDASAD